MCTPATASVGPVNLTGTGVCALALIVFSIAYLVVMLEEKLHLRKSKPVLVAAGIIWSLIGWVYIQQGITGIVEDAYKHTLLEFSELMLFLLVAMTYINAWRSEACSIFLEPGWYTKGSVIGRYFG